MECPDFQNRFAALENRIPAINDSVQNIKTALNQSNRLIEAILLRKAALKDTNDSTRITDSIHLTNSIDLLQQSIQKDNEILANIAAPLMEYNRMKFFKERSEYIKRTIGKHWNYYSPNQAGGWETLFGWIITALAIMLGAPFWFDMLSKLISLRSTGTKIDPGDNSQPNPQPVVASTQTGIQTPSSNNNADQEAVG